MIPHILPTSVHDSANSMNRSDHDPGDPTDFGSSATRRTRLPARSPVATVPLSEARNSRSTPRQRTGATVKPAASRLTPHPGATGVAGSAVSTLPPAFQITAAMPSPDYFPVSARQIIMTGS